MKKTVLQNGLTVVTHSNESFPIVTLYYFIKSGSFHGVGFHDGIAHMTEHMLYKGTKNRTAREIAVELDSIGYDSNAYTSFERTVLFATGPSENIQTAFSVLTEAIFESVIPNDELEKEKRIIQDEIIDDLDSPDSFAMSKLQEVMHRNNSHRRSILGSLASVEKTTKEEVLRFMKMHYVPKNMTLIASGNVEHDQLVEWIADYLKDKSFAPFQNTRPAFQEESLRYKIHRYQRGLEQINVSWGFHVPAPANENIYTIAVINTLLSEGYSSRLFDVIREQLALAYEIDSGYDIVIDDVTMWGFAKINKIEGIEEIIWAEYQKLVNEAVSEDELNKAKNYLYGSYLRDQTSPEDQCDWIATNLLLNRPLDENIKEAIWSVSAQNIQEFAQKYFRKDNLCFVEIF